MLVRWMDRMHVGEQLKQTSIETLEGDLLFSFGYDGLLVACAMLI